MEEMGDEDVRKLIRYIDEAGPSTTLAITIGLFEKYASYPQEKRFEKEYKYLIAELNKILAYVDAIIAREDSKRIVILKPIQDEGGLVDVKDLIK